MSEPAVGICVVTYKRPQQLLKALSWIQERTRYPNYKLYVIIDHEEDSATIGALVRSRFTDYTVEMFTSRVECVKATNRCNSIGDEPYFVYLSDDMEVEEGWLQEAMKCMQTIPNGNGLVVFKDGIQNGRNACAGLISRNYIRAHLGGIFYNEVYVHFSADTELFKKSRTRNRLRYCPTSVVWHNHWGGSGGHKSGKDVIYTGSRYLLAADRAMLRKRIQEEFR